MKKLLYKIIDFSLLRRVLRLVKPYRKTFYVAVSLAITMAALSILNPLLIQTTVDRYILGNNWSMLVYMSVILVISLLIQSFLNNRFTFTTSWLGQNIVRDLRTRVYSHVLNLNLRYFDRTPLGTIITRTISDIEAINDIFAEGIITILSDLLTVVAVLGAMFYTSWKLTLVCMAVLPLLLAGTYIFKEGIRKSFTEVRNQVARLNAFLQEHITGMSVVQIFHAEDREFNHFKSINADYRRANIQSNFYYSIFFPFVELISALALGLLIWYGAYGMLKDESSPGIIIAFIMYLNLLFRPIRTLADKFNTLQMGMVASERVFKLIDHDDKMENRGMNFAKNIKGNIEFNHVWFAYDDEHYVLKNVSFHVQQGQTLAIVGQTGAGKTSIISLLSRFYEIQKGSIFVDDVNIRDYELFSLRRNIGLVLQDVFLFSGSVSDNITLRNSDIKMERVRHAAELCGIDDWIERLPGGYNYNVMERGATLSVGQRQLISFVRALVYDPKILILDEATSSIDTESERLIQSAIEKLIQNRTSIIIAHRLSTIRHAHKIMVLERGEVKEIGTHEELLEMNGAYKKLYEMQFMKKELVS